MRGTWSVIKTPFVFFYATLYRGLYYPAKDSNKPPHGSLYTSTNCTVNQPLKMERNHFTFYPAPLDQATPHRVQVAHANFGKNKQYFLRAPCLWFEVGSCWARSREICKIHSEVSMKDGCSQNLPKVQTSKDLNIQLLKLFVLQRFKRKEVHGFFSIQIMGNGVFLKRWIESLTGTDPDSKQRNQIWTSQTLGKRTELFLVLVGSLKMHSFWMSSCFG